MFSLSGKMRTTFLSPIFHNCDKMFIKKEDVINMRISSKNKKWVGGIVLICLLVMIVGLVVKSNSSEVGDVSTLVEGEYQQGEDRVVEMNDRVVEMNGVKLTLKFVKAGSFRMGSPTTEKDRKDDEAQFRVTLKDYWLGKTEVTQEQYEAVMGENPSYFRKGGNYPVERVSWTGAMVFCERLTKAERANGNLPDGYEYKLPTEAQWEYAARGGHKNSRYHIYSGGDEINDVAWYYNNSKRSTHPVAQKHANELGLYDMSGNVEEWCRDIYEANPYSAIKEPPDDLPPEGPCRVLRGGSWCSNSKHCRSANRECQSPKDRLDLFGFRVALAPVQFH